MCACFRGGLPVFEDEVLSIPFTIVGKNQNTLFSLLLQKRSTESLTNKTERRRRRQTGKAAPLERTAETQEALHHRRASSGRASASRRPTTARAFFSDFSDFSFFSQEALKSFPPSKTLFDQCFRRPKTCQKLGTYR